MTTPKIALFLATTIIFLIPHMHAAFNLRLLEGISFKGSEVGEIMYDRTDIIINNREYLELSKSEFTKFIDEGTFSNDFDKMGAIDVWARAHNAKGGRIICTGYFATTTGEIFRFDRINEKIMKLEDSNYAVGWLVLVDAK